MLKYSLIHPEILETLGRAGHGSQILIADGNYPFETTLGPNATLVSLNLRPGLIDCVQVLESLVTAVPVEAAAVMAVQKTGPYALKEDPPIWGDFKRVLASAGFAGPLEQIERFEFYRTAATERVALTIATGEQRIYANLLLTIGVVMPNQG